MAGANSSPLYVDGNICVVLVRFMRKPRRQFRLRPAVLGFEPGQWHARHDQIEAYLRAVNAAAPERTQFEIIGRTHEQRPLLQLTLSSARNMQRLEQIRTAHLAVSRGEKQPDPDLPAIIWLGYSIHGNEASGANAALRVVHQLLSAEDPTGQIPA